MPKLSVSPSDRVGSSARIASSAAPEVAAPEAASTTATAGSRSIASMAGNIAAGAARLALPAATAYFGSTVPAGAGENEFARQAKYGAKATPASGRTGAGMNKTMNRVSSTVTSKPVTPASAPKPAAAPTPTANKAGFYKGGSQGDYTVKRGETLSGIAKRTGQSVSDLAKMNKISDVNKISSGAKLMTKVPTPPSRPANLSTPAPASSDSVRNVKTTVSSNAGDIARQVVKTPYGSTQSVATSLATVGSKPAQASGSDITDKATYDTKTTKPAPFQSGSSSVKLPSEPEKFSGSAEGPAPLAKPSAPAPAPAAPAPEPKKKEAGAVPAAPMAESVVTVGANKYRIV